MQKVTVRKLKPGAWHGYDFDSVRLALAGENAECQMSEKRARNLMADYPGGFDVVGAVGAVGVVSAEVDSGESAPIISKPQVEKRKRGRPRK